MNNIYKVIWSKAKNCYVVASEIARSHTKSATGSEKIEGVTRRSLLASLMALSLLCGGLGVAEATVHVNEGTGVTSEVYTTGETYSRELVDEKLNSKANANDVATNTANIANLENNKLSKADASITYATKADVNTELTKKADKTYVDNALNDKADKADVYSKTDAENTFATKTELTAKADATALAGKANTDLSNLTEAGKTAIKTTMTDELAKKADNDTVTVLDGRVGVVEGKVAALETTVGDDSNGLVKDVNDLKTQGNALNTALGNKADQSDLDAAKAKITTNETNITALQKKTTGLSDDGKSLTEMNSVETGALTVKGEIKNDAGVTTTLTDIKASMDKANANETAIGQLQTTTTNQQTAIDGLNKKTTKITYDAALGTSVDGVTFNAGAVTGVTSINGTEIGTKESGSYISQDGSIWGNMKKVDTQVKTNADNIETNKNDITKLDAKVGTVGTGTYLDPIKSVGENLGLLDAGLKQEVADRKAAIGELAVNGNYIEKDKNVSDNLVKLDNQAKANADEIVKTNERTGGIKRNTEKTQTTIEDSVKVDKQGNVKDVNELSAKTITTTGNADLKGNVTLGTTAANTVTVNGTADFNEAVNMDKGLTVTNGETNLKKTTVDGDLKVTGTITTDKMVFGDKPTNYTEIDHGKVTSKNLEVNGAGQTISSSSIFNAEENKVGFANNATGDQSFHKQTSDIIMDNVKDRDNSNYRTQTKTETKDIIKDKDGNSSTTSQTASENQTYLKDKDGKNTNSTIDTAKGYDKTIKGENGETSTKQDELNITNTAKYGTITNDANHIENKANTMNTTVSGQATESYGGLNTTVTGAENHTVTGMQTNTVGDGQINNITGGQINNILTGDQKTTVSNGSIINKAENGNISNTATNVTNEGTESVTNKVRANEVKVYTNGVDITAEAGKKITESVGTASRVVENDKITDKAADSTVTTENGKGTTFGKEGSTGTTNIYGDSIRTGTINAEDTTTAKLTAGAAAGADGGRLTVDASDGVKGSYKSGDYTSRSYILANTLKSGVDNGKEPIDADFVGSRTDHYMDGDKAKLDETVKDAAGSNVTNKTSTGTVTTITDGTTTTETEQGVKDITNTAKNGTITNDAKDIVNIAKDTITNTAGTSITNQVNDSKVTTDANGTTFENNTPAVSDGGATTTKINGNQITTGRVNANELDVSDTDGNNKADLLVKAGEGVKASASDGNTTGSLDVTADEVTTSIKSGSKANTVISTADGTSFINSEAAAPVTGASGAGTAVNTTIKGNTITTGKVTMDYAEVMKDLGVRGNANITGKTTTGSLEVTGTSTLKGDVTMESNATVNGNFSVGGNTNLKNTEVDGTLNVTQKATFGDSVSIAKDLSVGGDVKANSYKVGDKTYIDANGIHANGQKITDVADGSISEGSKDAVNGGQLYGVKRDLEHQVDKVGANAAAMANLRPMEFDPSSKWNIAAAIGNYGSETAAALGAFYRPNDDVMVNLSTAFGTGENMVGGGVSVRLGKGGNKLSREENNALKDQVNDLTARMDALLSVLNPNMSKDFPDVPENHWAYEAVSRLAGNDIVQGYPDGEFHGERTMTRYEMAEIIYNALSRGAEAERELVEEFKPELQAMAASEKATAEKAEG